MVNISNKTLAFLVIIALIIFLNLTLNMPEGLEGAATKDNLPGQNNEFKNVSPLLIFVIIMLIIVNIIMLFLHLKKKS